MFLKVKGLGMGGGGGYHLEILLAHMSQKLKVSFFDRSLSLRP